MLYVRQIIHQSLTTFETILYGPKHGLDTELYGMFQYQNVCHIYQELQNRLDGRCSLTSCLLDIGVLFLKFIVIIWNTIVEAHAMESHSRVALECFSGVNQNMAVD